MKHRRSTRHLAAFRAWLRREHRLATGADFPTPAQLAAIKARAAALDEKRRRESGYWHRVQCRLFANRTDAVRVNGLGAQADAVTSYGFNDDWKIYPLGTDALEGKGWVIAWPARILVIGDPGELDLARYVASTRSRARGDLSRSLVGLVAHADLRGDRLTEVLRPQYETVIAQHRKELVRCPSCRCRVRAWRHRPGDEDCVEYAAARAE